MNAGLYMQKVVTQLSRGQNDKVQKAVKLSGNDYLRAAQAYDDLLNKEINVLEALLERIERFVVL